MAIVRREQLSRYNVPLRVALPAFERYTLFQLAKLCVLSSTESQTSWTKKPEYKLNSRTIRAPETLPQNLIQYAA